MIQIYVQCLGVFREVGDGFEVCVEEASVGAIRVAVSDYLTRMDRVDLRDVLNRSIFAEGDQLLKDNAVIQGSVVGLLPPVAGG